MVTVTNVPKVGPSFDFYKKLTVTWSSFGQNSPQPDIIIPFSTSGILILNEDTSNVIQVSFNGTDIHDEINPTIIRAVTYDNRVVSLVWLKLVTGGSAVVSLRAWGIR